MNKLLPIFYAILFTAGLLAAQAFTKAAGLEPEPLDIIDNTDWIED